MRYEILQPVSATGRPAGVAQVHVIVQELIHDVARQVLAPSCVLVMANADAWKTVGIMSDRISKSCQLRGVHHGANERHHGLI